MSHTLLPTVVILFANIVIEYMVHVLSFGAKGVGRDKKVCDQVRL